MTHALWEELAAGRALDALEPEDEDSFGAHLRGCDLCARTYAEMRSLGAQLAYAVDDLEPPPGMRSSIAAAVRSSDRPSVFPTQDVRGHPRFGFVPRPVGVGLRIGAVLLVVTGVLGWNLALRAQTQVQSAAITKRNEFLAGFDAKGAARAFLVQPEGSVAGAAVIRNGKVALEIHGLPVSDAAHSYVLWWREASGAYHAIHSFAIAHTGVNVFPLIGTVADPSLVAALAVSRESGLVPPAAPTNTIVDGTLER